MFCFVSFSLPFALWRCELDSFQVGFEIILRWFERTLPKFQVTSIRNEFYEKLCLTIFQVLRHRHRQMSKKKKKNNGRMCLNQGKKMVKVCLCVRNSEYKFRSLVSILESRNSCMQLFKALSEKEKWKTKRRTEKQSSVQTDNFLLVPHNCFQAFFRCTK